MIKVSNVETIELAISISPCSTHKRVLTTYWKDKILMVKINSCKHYDKVFHYQVTRIHDKRIGKKDPFSSQNWF